MYLYLVTYDICDPKRLRKVYRLMRGYGDHLPRWWLEMSPVPFSICRLMRRHLPALILSCPRFYCSISLHQKRHQNQAL